MMMRFRGGGVGHKSTRESTAVFLEDRDPLDEITRDDSKEDFEDLESGINQGAQLSARSASTTAQNQATGDEDKDNIESEMDEYGYGGLDEEEEATDEEDEEQGDGLEEANDKVGPEDGEDDAMDEYEGYAEL
ncbi:uncharacterized protein F5147DRAFT_777641 [Suillus discolor]|uniref:Uncharacterized protein n=1 Tax=Suillus discolor TaxID=1912936 RepID=A0A9P7JQD2_9AGAM|nr:uncharacterized protein F5147DRAFT_777641 [Suillus discolor]KAG2098398.1 hypothetical protein F5147DRAFT_777641 [Suillus discolor]